MNFSNAACDPISYFAAHAVALQHADAVLAGDGAAERDGGVEELLERGLGRDARGLVAAAA